jgi:8-oxo-dGTP pyrophosphatase MutT (NUDIX family)
VTLYERAVATLETWTAPSERDEELRRRYLEHLGMHPDGLSRHCHPDHLTAGAVVVSHDRRQVLLNLHGKYRVWLQFGGHCEEADRDLATAALRETREESGIAELELVSDQPVQLDSHEVRCGPVHPAHHLDVRYAAVAPPGARAQASSESVDVRWFARDELPRGLEPSVRELVARALVV